MATWLVFSYLWLPYMILPYLRRPGADPGVVARGIGRPRRGRRDDLPAGGAAARPPAVVAGSIFTFALTLGDYITPPLVMDSTQFIGNVIYTNVGVADDVPLAAAYAYVPIVDHGRLPARRAPRRAPSRRSDAALRTVARAVLAAGDGDLAGHALRPARDRRGLAFDSKRVQKWPPAGLTFSGSTRPSTTRVPAKRCSRVKAGLAATAIALVLGTWPIARPAVPVLRPRHGLVARDPADRAARDRDRHGAELDVHPGARGAPRAADDRRRPCDVLHRRHVQQRRGPVAAHFAVVEEASADLGANSLQTFRYVVFPQLRSALVAGALLAFALSFDEVIVTTFTAGQQQTLPLWIFANLSRPRQLPIVNVVAVLAILLSLIPVWIAQRITADPVSAGAARAEAGGEAGA